MHQQMTQYCVSTRERSLSLLLSKCNNINMCVGGAYEYVLLLPCICFSPQQQALQPTFVIHQYLMIIYLSSLGHQVCLLCANPIER